MPNLLVPNSSFQGFFHTPPLGNYTGMWTSFNLDTDWKPQIDEIRSKGANVLVYFGSAEAGHANLSAYLANNVLVADYLASKGMYGLCYGMGGTMDQWAPAAISLAQAITVATAQAALLSTLPNMLGYVIVDEPWASYTGYGGTMTVGAVAAFCQDAYVAVKAAVPANFPICAAPNMCGQSAGANVFDYGAIGQPLADSVEPYCDFLVFHPFYAVAPADFADVAAAFPTKQLAFPSSVDEINGSPTLTATINACVGIIGTNDVRLGGVFLVEDFSVTTEGFWNADHTPRTAKTDLFVANLLPSPSYYGPYVYSPNLGVVRFAGFVAAGLAT